MTDRPFIHELIEFHAKLFSLDVQSALQICIALVGLQVLLWGVLRGRLVGSKRKE